MKPMITNSHAMPVAQLDRALELAVVQSWDELMPESTSGLIHIEYQTGKDGSLDYAIIWASTIRGHWNLICELWMKPLWSHATGLRFRGDPPPAGFAETLEFISLHENAFLKLPDQHGLIQISTPTPDERKAAEQWTAVAFNNYGPMPVQHDAA